MTTPLSDEALADLLRDMEDVQRREYVETNIEVDTVAALIREVQAGRSFMSGCVPHPRDVGLSNDDIAKMVADCERREKEWRENGAEVGEDPQIGCDTATYLGKQVLLLRADRETLRASLVRLSPPDAIRNENNALRKNNERLTKENARLREACRRATSANTTAQTMAGYWKIKATGEPLDD